jgi:uncharacterized protein (TIGR03067 family)
MRRFVLVSVVLTVAFAPAPLPRHDRRPKAENLMLGLWSGNSVIEVTPDRLTYHPGAAHRCEYVLRFDTSVSPWRYDITGVPGSSTAGRVYAGIYKVEGDTLTLCYNGGTSRPANFDRGGGLTEVYKRSRR